MSGRRRIDGRHDTQHVIRLHHEVLVRGQLLDAGGAGALFRRGAAGGDVCYYVEVVGEEEGGDAEAHLADGEDGYGGVGGWHGGWSIS